MLPTDLEAQEAAAWTGFLQRLGVGLAGRRQGGDDPQYDPRRAVHGVFADRGDRCRGHVDLAAQLRVAGEHLAAAAAHRDLQARALGCAGKQAGQQAPAGRGDEVVHGAAFDQRPAWVAQFDVQASGQAVAVLE